MANAESAAMSAGSLGSAEDETPNQPIDGESRSGLAAVAAMAALIAALVAAGLASLSATDALVLLGIPDPGVATRYGLPAVQSVGYVAAVAAVGCALLAAFLVPPQSNGVLDVGGYRAIRVCGGAAAIWAACAFLMVPLTLSDVSGAGFLEAVRPENLWPSLPRVDTALAWAWTGVFASTLAMVSRAVLRWSWTPALLALSLFTLMPLVLTGHSASGGSHDVATNSLFWHIVGASLWMGGLFAVLMHAWHGGEHLALVVRRYSLLAGISFAAVGLSGIVNAFVRIELGDLFSDAYGRIVLVKAVALVFLGVFGWSQRRRVVGVLHRDAHARTPFVTLAVAEFFILAATFGLAVALGRTPPPAPSSVPTLMEVELGYNLEGSPTFARLMLDWRFDLIFGTLAIVLAVLYAVGVRKLNARGDAWPIGRTIAWLSGCVVLLIATSSGIARYAPAMFSVHMGSHMLLSMLVPVLLVLGGPVTLALRALKPAGKGGVPGPREWILAAVNSPVSRFLTQPVIAAILFVAGFYGLYFGGIFDAYVGSHAAHILMNLHFLLSGYLFYWVVIGVDQSPHPMQPLAKLGVLWATLPFHAFFGIALMNMETVMGGWFYQQLNLPWVPDLLADQRVGGGLAWGTGEMPLIIVMLALLVQWSRTDRRFARRMDRVADNDDDAALAAYNAMFAELARKEAERQGK
ncbi:cytochrome c oxidase assembly protein [Hoyosella altamirensis]|uniref:Putative copper resistance protein D n=1 Tax=Hoyosella altamirensis TaxID=616997 RepID=A0A839RS27_9ACTN|nr:cytochrome c oxidase assembly protein [Hoyosella altamirensis]MBB3039129.1 putative copper resistance protein D [Hoyosella altamirensis]